MRKSVESRLEEVGVEMGKTKQQGKSSSFRIFSVCIWSFSSSRSVVVKLRALVKSDICFLCTCLVVSGQLNELGETKRHWNFKMKQRTQRCDAVGGLRVFRGWFLISHCGFAITHFVFSISNSNGTVKSGFWMAQLQHKLLSTSECMKLCFDSITEALWWLSVE